jgi:hypothetical protein
MSGEFGGGGYFHDKMRAAVEDCEGGHEDITRKFVPVMREVSRIAHLLSWVEAGDSSGDESLLELDGHALALEIAVARYRRWVQQQMEKAPSGT